MHTEVTTASPVLTPSWSQSNALLPPSPWARSLVHVAQAADLQPGCNCVVHIHIILNMKIMKDDGLSNFHVWSWGLDSKAVWPKQNRGVWNVVMEKILEIRQTDNGINESTLNELNIKRELMAEVTALMTHGVWKCMTTCTNCVGRHCGGQMISTEA